jgi:hypothetical protein
MRGEELTDQATPGNAEAEGLSCRSGSDRLWHGYVLPLVCAAVDLGQCHRVARPLTDGEGHLGHGRQRAEGSVFGIAMG